jgi:glutathione S-transferase
MLKTHKNKLTLISHKLCPYVQRAVIALEEQCIEYKRIDIDLNNPPDWFLQLSPLGKVPVLVVDDDNVLFESAVIAEYINEIGTGKLLSNTPIDKARERAWIEFASATLGNIGSLYSAAGEQDYLKAKSQLESKWRQLDNILTDPTYFSGGEFTLVNAAYAPVFRYLDCSSNLSNLNFWSAIRRLRAGVKHWRNVLR